MDCYLPEELVFRILQRLPLNKCLVRLRLVCKSWCSLLSNPPFIYSSIFSNTDDAKLLVKFGNTISWGNVRYFYSFLSDETLEISMPPRDLPFYNVGLCTRLLQCEFNKDIVQFVGCSNGLICITNNQDHEHVVLWNPATSQTKIIPESNVPHRPVAPDRRHFVGMGFGFDPKTEDYKVVRIYLSDQWMTDFAIEVYSLKNDSWKGLHVTLPAYMLESNIGLCFGNAYLWCAFDNPQFSIESIVSFEMSTETFKKTLLPDFSHFGSFKKIFVLKDSLAMVSTITQTERHEGEDTIYGNVSVIGQTLEIWVLLEYGVKESWIKLFRIEHLLNIRMPLIFKRNGELFLETRDGQIMLYDPLTQKFRTLPIYGDSRTIQILAYKESSMVLASSN